MPRSTLFVHGGLLPEHAQYGMERLNAETAAWLQGRTPTMPEFLGGRSAIVWAREYSAGATFASLRRQHHLKRPTKVWLQGAATDVPVKQSRL